jgi:hypothetical protein
MKTYTEFVSLFQAFKINRMLGNTESIGNTPDAFIANIDNILDKAKIFRIDNDTKRLLLLTKLPKINSHLKLPFPETFIDVEFTKKDIEMYCGDAWFETKGVGKVGIKRIIGIATTRGDLMSTTDDTIVGNALRMTTVSERDDGYIWFDTFNDDLNITDERAKNFKVKNVPINSKLKQMIFHFVVAFLNLLYNPDVEIVEIERTDEQNIKRIRRGKFPIPSIHSIRVTGRLKIYLDELKNSGLIMDDNYYKFSFWVRGFFRTLRSDKYKENVGKRLFVPPFVKGKGLLIEKEYYVKKQNN